MNYITTDKVWRLSRLTYVCIVIALCSNLVFCTFPCRKFHNLTWNSVYNDLSWSNTDQVWLEFFFTYFYVSDWPLLTLVFLTVSMSCLKILNWNLAYELVLTWVDQKVPKLILYRKIYLSWLNKLWSFHYRYLSTWRADDVITF